MLYHQLTLSANAGVALHCGSVRIWSDALHNQRTPGFSAVTPAIWDALQTHPDFADPDVMFYTHCHPDHYSRSLTIQAKKWFPDARLILPEREFPDQVLLTGARCHLCLPGLTMQFALLTHEGPQYAAVPNYGCILDDGDFRILIAGDCAVANPELAEFVGNSPIDLALLDFPWVTLRKGRQFIEQYIRPRHLAVYHLPFAENNRWGYREAAAKGAALLQNIPDVRLVQDPFQREIFD